MMPALYRATQLVAVSRDGAERTLPLESARRLNPRVSPDGRKVMVEAFGLRMDAYDFERQTTTRLTADMPGTGFGLWNRDGTSIILRRFNAPYWFSAGGDGGEGVVPDGEANDYLSGAGPDPDTFFSTRVRPETAGDIFLLSKSGRFAPKAVIATPTYDGGAQLSPDGRHLVLVSGVSGQLEIFVARYPAVDRRWAVSAGPGVQPRWRRDGSEIFYRDGHNMMAIEFDGGRTEPRLGKPIALFRDVYDLGQGATIANYDVTSDGRFMMLRRDPKGANLRLTLNWVEEMKAIIAAGGVK